MGGLTPNIKADCQHQTLLHGCEFPQCQNCGAVWFGMRAYRHEMDMRARGLWGKNGAGYNPHGIERAVQNFDGRSLSRF